MDEPINYKKRKNVIHSKNKLIVKLDKTQSKMFHDLIKFFKENKDRIDQTQMRIKVNSKACGCFGALLAEYFNLKNYHSETKTKYHCYHRGGNHLRKILNIDWEEFYILFSENGAKVNPLGWSQWKTKPHKVLHSILMEGGASES